VRAANNAAASRETGIEGNIIVFADTRFGGATRVFFDFYHE